MIQVMVQASNIFIPFNVFYFVLSFSSPLLITFVYLLLCSLFLSYFFQLSKVTFVYLLFKKCFNYFFQLIELTSKDIMNKRCNIVVVLSPLVENPKEPTHCNVAPSLFLCPLHNIKEVCYFSTPPNLWLGPCVYDEQV